MQDRILGPLTMVQFVYAVVGFGLCYVIYLSPLPKALSMLIIIPIATLVFCLDFVKVNERPFLEFLLAALSFIAAPKQRIWHQGDDSDLQIEVYHVEKITSAAPAHKNISSEEIKAFASKTDTEGNETIKI